MGIFDDLESDLDSAFDFMTAPGDDKEPKEAVKATSVADMPEELAELKAALADDNLIPLTALLALRKKLQRRYHVSALIGALAFLRAVDTNAARIDHGQALDGLLRTKAGAARKVLNADQRTRLEALSDVFGAAPAQDILKQIRSYVELLQRLPEIDPDDVRKLFSVGIWRPDQFHDARVESLSRLSLVEPAKIAVVHAHLNQ